MATPTAIPRTNTRTTSTRITTPRTSKSRFVSTRIPDDEPESDVLEQRQEVPYDQDEDEPW